MRFATEKLQTCVESKQTKIAMVTSVCILNICPY